MRYIPALLAVIFTGHVAWAASPASGVTAQLKASDGTERGNVTLVEGPNGILATIEASGLPANSWHAIHVHEVGDCSDEAFTKAGEHAAPKKHLHGFLVKGGMHLGDMPNIWADDAGNVKAQHFLKDVALKNLLDKDGAAVVIHAKEDDYRSQPSGDAGDRLACGVVTQ